MNIGGHWNNGAYASGQPIGCRASLIPSDKVDPPHKSDIDKLSSNIDWLTFWIIILIIVNIIF